MNGASGRYEGAVVKETGTVIGVIECGEPGGRQLPVKAVQGSCVVASTTPGSMPPTGEPMPGNKLTPLKFPPPPPVAAPICALKPGKPRRPLPAVSPNVPAEPPTNGYCTNGWLKAGRNRDCPAMLPTFGPEGARMIAAGLPSVVAPKKSCEFGR